jgi:DNA invertase Pin-like site-specific DNA recombinase
MHSCDNPRCVNPRHLSVGTHQDNADDKVAKNRQARMFGEDNPASKLTEKQVIDIRTERISQAEFAKLYDIDSSQISRITNNLKWTNL